jgi:hydrophobe/amphiphile efflux-1 (HAE1) family protein
MLAALTRHCVRRPLTAWILLSGVTLLGCLALARIGVSHFPDVDRASINVFASLPGVAPKTMERDVAELLEETLVQAEGVEGIVATVENGRVRLELKLQPGRDVDSALQDAQNRVARIAPQLPKGLNPIALNKYNPEDMPIVLMVLTGPYSPQRLSDTAATIIHDAIQGVPGVGSVAIYGPQGRTLKVWLDRARLAERGLAISDVVAGLRANNLETSGGTIEGAGGDLAVRMLGQPRRVADLAEIPIATRVTPGGAVATVRLGDLAIIEDGFIDNRNISRMDGQHRQGLGVGKLRGFNTVTVARDVRAAVDRLNAELPKGMRLEVTQDSSQWVKESIGSMWHELVIAVLLTAAVCWMFLGSFASGSTVLLAIPMALLGTVAALWIGGGSINTFTMLGMALAIGLVVDDAIMVQESIEHHHGLGLSSRDAAVRGTGAVRFAALAATIAVLAVFAPVLFIRGEIGAYFFQFGFALCVAVSISYLEAVTMAPARAAQFLASAGAAAGPSRLWPILDRCYAPLLRLAVRRPLAVLAAAALLTAIGAWALAAIPREMSPDQDSGRIRVAWNAPATADQARIEALVDILSDRLGSLPGALHVQVSGNGASGTCGILLAPPAERPPQAEIIAEARRRLGGIPGLACSVQADVQTLIRVSNPAAADLSVRGPEHERCAAIAEEIMGRWRADPHLVDVTSSWKVAAAELTIVPDRAACADLGVELDDLAVTVDSLIGGSLAGSFALDGRRQDVRVRLRADQRANPEDISRLLVRTRAGAAIPLSALARVVVQPAPARLMRLDREPAVTISANAPAGVAQGQAQAAALALVGDLPPGYRVVPGDSAVAMRQAVDDLGSALAVGLVVAFLVMAVQFNSLLHPLTVLTALPLAAAGAGIALWLSGQSLNIYSGLGLLLLMGLAKKNSILLVDRANHACASGEAADPAQAMAIAGPARLRAILMTSVATCAAAVPIALGLGEGAEVRRPMAIAILGGIIVSTVLSLVVVPAFYVVTSRLLRRRAAA